MNAARQIVEDEIPMEDRTPKLESDVKHIKHDVQVLHAKVDVGNEKIANLDKRVDHLDKRMDYLTTRVDKVSDAQAALGGQVEGLAATQASLATKEELRRVEGELKADIRNVEGELKASVGRLEKAITATADGTELRLIKWVVGTAIAAVTASRVLSMLDGDPISAASAPSPTKSEAPVVSTPEGTAPR